MKIIRGKVKNSNRTLKNMSLVVIVPFGVLITGLNKNLTKKS